MTGTVCLAIGIGDAPPLDYLRGAVNGAYGIAAWANEQKYPVTLLTDEQRPVERAEVTEALKDLLESSPETLILYFAGHGLSRAAGDDLWLLSRWYEEDRAILVNGLRDRLARHGLKRLVLISDACRSPIDVDTQSIEGDSLLNRGPYDENVPQMDIWYAASRGRAAFMIPGATALETRCIFSGLLNEALAGAHAAAFDSKDPQQPITSFSLADFMEKEVPARAAHYGVKLTPVITTSIRPPDNRYRTSPPATPPEIHPWPPVCDAPVTAMDRTKHSQRLAPPLGASWTTGDETQVHWERPELGYVPTPRRQPASIPGPHRSRTGTTVRLATSLFWSSIIPFGAFLAAGVLVSHFLFPESSDPRIASNTLGFQAIDLVGFIEFLVIALLVIAAITIAAMTCRRFWLRRQTLEAKIDLELDHIHIDSITEHLSRTRAPRDDRHHATADEWRHPQSSFGVVASRAKIESCVFDSKIYKLLPTTASDRTLHLGYRKRRLVTPTHPLDLLVELGNSTWAAAAIFPGFVLSIDAGREGVRKAVYRKMHGDITVESEHMLDEFAARGIEGDQTLEVVQALRGSKSANPMLGVIAAWLHHLQGDIANICRMAYYFAAQGIPVPFDVALLGRLETEPAGKGGSKLIIPAVEEEAGRPSLPHFLREATPQINGVLAGRYPLLRQGWSLLDPAGRPGLYHKGLAELEQHLMPAPFTTLTAEGGRQLADLIFSARTGP